MLFTTSRYMRHSTYYTILGECYVSLTYTHTHTLGTHTRYGYLIICSPTTRSKTLSCNGRCRNSKVCQRMSKGLSTISMLCLRFGEITHTCMHACMIAYIHHITSHHITLHMHSHVRLIIAIIYKYYAVTQWYSSEYTGWQIGIWISIRPIFVISICTSSNAGSRILDPKRWNHVVIHSKSSIHPGRCIPLKAQIPRARKKSHTR